MAQTAGWVAEFDQFTPVGPVDLTGGVEGPEHDIASLQSMGAQGKPSKGEGGSTSTVEELQAEMKLLNWHKLANEAALKVGGGSVGQPESCSFFFFGVVREGRRLIDWSAGRQTKSIAPPCFMVEEETNALTYSFLGSLVDSLVHERTNERMLQAALIRTKKLRGAEKAIAKQTLQDKAAWMQQVIEEEQKKPLQVSKEFITSYEAQERRDGYDALTV